MFSNLGKAFFIMKWVLVLFIIHHFYISISQLSQWMKEKYQTATDESYRDLGNLQEKLKKHQAFELELKANNDRLNQLNEARILIVPC